VGTFDLDGDVMGGFERRIDWSELEFGEGIDKCIKSWRDFDLLKLMLMLMECRKKKFGTIRLYTNRFRYNQ
jgi:hypothetical protein